MLYKVLCVRGGRLTSPYYHRFEWKPDVPRADSRHGLYAFSCLGPEAFRELREDVSYNLEYRLYRAVGEGVAQRHWWRDSLIVVCGQMTVTTPVTGNF